MVSCERVRKDFLSILLKTFLTVTFNCLCSFLLESQHEHIKVFQLWESQLPFCCYGDRISTVAVGSSLIISLRKDSSGLLYFPNVQPLCVLHLLLPSQALWFLWAHCVLGGLIQHKYRFLCYSPIKMFKQYKQQFG